MNRFRSIFSNINRQQGGFLNTATRSTRTNKHSTNTIWKPKKASSHNYYSTNSKGKVKSIHNVDESVVDIEHRRKLYSLKTFSLALVPIITFGLGYWQYKRLGWKQDLLDFVNGRIHKPPVVFTGTEGVSSTDIEYLKFRMFGTFDHQNEMRVGPITKDGTLGFNIITPFILDSDGSRVLVLRGFVDNNHADQSKRPDSLSTEKVELLVMGRKGQRYNKFTPESNPQSNEWFILDTDLMAKTSGSIPLLFETLHDNKKEKLLNSTKYLKEGIPIPSQVSTLLNIPNDHAQYMFTWFGLCLASSIMFYLNIRKPQKSAAQKRIAFRR